MTKSNTLKKLVSLLLMAAMVLTLFACNENQKESESEPETDPTEPAEVVIDLDSLDCKGECGDIKHFIQEAEKKTNLSSDAQDYLDLVKKNLAKMVDGYACTEKATQEILDEAAPYKVEVNYQYKAQGGIYYEGGTATTSDSPTPFTMTTWGAEDGSRYVEQINDNETFRTKLPPAEGPDYENVLGDSGISARLFPSEEFDTFLASIKKSIEGQNTVFTFKTSFKDLVVEALHMKNSNETEGKVVFDENGALKTIEVSMEIQQEELTTHVVSENTQTYLYTFTEIGVKQNITLPENIEDFEEVTY